MFWIMVVPVAHDAGCKWGIPITPTHPMLGTAEHGSGLPLRGEEDEAALHRADTRCRIIGRNGQRFAGRLVAVNSEERILGLISESQLGPYTREIPFDAIDEIQYTAPGRIQGSYVFWGFLVGAAAGALIGQTVDSGKEVGSDSGGAVTGAAIGAGVGILVSGGISFFVPSKRRIRCAAEE
jgi:hypothetical protein